MIGLKRVLAYFIILLVVGLFFWGVYVKLSKQPILDNTRQMLELGLVDIGNEFIKIERPSFKQFISSPLIVKLALSNTSGVNVYLKDVNENVLVKESIDTNADDLNYIVNLVFAAAPGDGYLDIEPFEADKAGVRLPIRFGN